MAEAMGSVCFDYIVRELQYVRDYGANIAELKQEFMKLEKLRGEVEELAAGVVSNEETARTIGKWLADADRVSSDAKQIMEGDERSSTTCLCLTSLVSDYRMSKRAACEVTKMIEMHREVETIKEKLFLQVDWLEDLLVTSPQFQGYLKFDSRVHTLHRILLALQDSRVKRIWLHGPGGSGMTTLVKQVTACAAKLGLFDGVATATAVTQLWKEALVGVQRQLANTLGLTRLTLGNKLRENRELIHRRLMNGKFLVIVEDVWKLEVDEDLLMQKIGIPSGCKILLTSRSWDSNLLEHSLGSCTKESIGVLEEEEAWRLFDSTAGNDAKQPHVGAIGRQVVKRCKGLPVLIVTIAAALSKRPTLSAWEEALVQLEGMKNMELHEYINSAVEFICYNHLRHLHKSLFLLCALLENINGDQIAISDLRSEWLQLEGMGGRASLDSLIFDLKASYLLQQGESNNYVKMHDLVRYAAIEIAYKARDMIQCVGESSSSKATTAQTAIQYATGGSVLGHTRFSRLLERVIPDSEMKHCTLLKELKALKRMNDLVSLISSYPMVIVTEEMHERWKTWMSLFSQLNSIRKEQLDYGSRYQPRRTVENVRSEISRRFSQIQPILEDILSYLPLDMMEDLGKVPELKALVELRTQMEPTQCQNEEIMGVESVPNQVLEFAIESANHHITTSTETVDWVGISGEWRHEVVQALKKDMAEKFQNVISVSVTEDWRGRIGQIEGDIIYESSSLYLIDLYESVDVSEWIQGCSEWEFLRCRKLVFISSSPISCLPVDLQIRMEDHFLPWKLFRWNAGPIVHSKVAGWLVKCCGGNLTAIILMARALRDESDFDVWSEALSKILPLMSNPRDVLDVAVNFVAKRLRWSVITKSCMGFALLECQPSYDSSMPGKSRAFLHSEKTRSRIVEPRSDSQWVDKTSLITLWKSEGIIHSEKEGLEILNSLVDAFLFEYSLSKPELTRVKPELFEVIYSILKSGDLVFGAFQGKVRKSKKLVLGGFKGKWPTSKKLVFRGYKGKVPTSKKQGGVEFDYGGTDLLELPANPSYNAVQKLLLQDNPELTIIPPCFFESMEVLKVLNMSNTSIKTLPESFFKLTTLTELVLRGCTLFMELPPQIGKLVTLKVLDLEGTEIIELPVDVQNLTNLVCLKVSFYGYGDLPETTIPAGVLMKLRQLTELSIDVNPDDERWEVDVTIAIREVATLQKLKYLKLYLPEMEHVYYLEKHFPLVIDSPYRQFQLTVGSHCRRIMSMTPPGVEAEFQKHSKSIRYVHGSEVPVKQLSYALQFTKAFFLDRHHTVTKLSRFGTGNMKQLEFCVLGECSELETIIEEGPHSHRGDHGEEEYSDEEEYIEEEEEEYFDEEDWKDDSSSLTEEPVLESLQYLIIYDMENLRSIWVSEVSIHKMSLSRLKSLRLHSCPQLSTIFNVSLLGNLGLLEELIVEDCESIKNLVDPHHQPSNLPSKPFLPNLKKISLLYLPELVSISSGLHIAPKLEQMSFYHCPNLKSLSDKEVSSKHLKKIRGEEEWWNGLHWKEAEWKEGRPSNLASVFITFKKDEDLMTQLAGDENPVKASSTNTKPNPRPGNIPIKDKLLRLPKAQKTFEQGSSNEAFEKRRRQGIDEEWTAMKASIVGRRPTQ